jgi:hypothetical protein
VFSGIPRKTPSTAGTSRKKVLWKRCIERYSVSGIRTVTLGPELDMGVLSHEEETKRVPTRYPAASKHRG